ncbi:hypothetical protein [Streptomyces sp. NPDC048350]|uniref:hypothetical protein n=1 Tax=Streptomyces sp. NPDC048350 TaxID=3365538 RepID=UPI00370FE832
MNAITAALDAEQMMQTLVATAGGPGTPAADMADLADLVRSLLDMEERRSTRVRLGGGLFDVVITGSGPQARDAVALMDEIQGGCGPVIEAPETGWLYWLVPPGSAQRWEPHTYAVCVGAPHTITLPPRERTRAPGPYWLRPSASDRLVPTIPLREALARLRPEPTPHAALSTRLGIS